MLRRTFLSGGMTALMAPAVFAKTAAYDRSTHSAIEALVRDQRFSGVIETGVGGKRQLSRAFGLADIEKAIPATPATRYALGSASKWLTTAGVLRLVDQGKLGLDQPITHYLPHYRKDTGEQVTLRRILSNTSGIPDLLTAAAKGDPGLRRSTASAEEIVSRYGQGDLAFAPGSRFDYSMMNWVILRALLEQQSGERFPALMERLVFKPLHLRKTGIAEHGFDVVPGLAKAYSNDLPPVRKIDPVPAFAAAAGTFYSDSGDMLRAVRMIFGPTFLSAHARAELIKVHVPEEEYALGGRVHIIDGQKWAWETGRIGGYRSHIAHGLDDQRTIVILCNNDIAQRDIGAAVERIAVG